jgi:hypothetical protein
MELAYQGRHDRLCDDIQHVGVFEAISINKSQHNVILRIVFSLLCLECRYAQCRIFISMLIVIMLSVVVPYQGPELV